MMSNGEVLSKTINRVIQEVQCYSHKYCETKDPQMKRYLHRPWWEVKQWAALEDYHAQSLEWNEIRKFAEPDIIKNGFKPDEMMDDLCEICGEDAYITFCKAIYNMKKRNFKISEKYMKEMSLL